MGTILLIAYCAWAIFSGYRVVSGHSEWLDRNAPMNAIVKFCVCTFVGGFIGGFYLIYFILHLLVHH